jgi:hypothetical protein
LRQQALLYQRILLLAHAGLRVRHRAVSKRRPTERRGRSDDYASVILASLTKKARTFGNR